MKTVFNYFFRGLLFTFPLFATFYVIALIINWVNDTLNTVLFSWLPIEIPGLGMITAFFLIVLLGFIITQAFARPMFMFLERLFTKIPFVKIIYTAFKDFTEAFVGDKRRFNKPVIVTLFEGVDRVGFVTEKDLTVLQVENRVAVYCPHSYNFSGNLFLVEPSKIRPLKIDPSDAMKYAVSAGVTNIDNFNN